MRFATFGLTCSCYIWFNLFLGAEDQNGVQSKYVKVQRHPTFMLKDTEAVQIGKVMMQR